jgi:hypothetical protein
MLLKFFMNNHKYLNFRLLILRRNNIDIYNFILEKLGDI